MDLKVLQRFIVDRDVEGILWQTPIGELQYQPPGFWNKALLFSVENYYYCPLENQIPYQLLNFNKIWTLDMGRQVSVRPACLLWFYVLLSHKFWHTKQYSIIMWKWYKQDPTWSGPENTKNCVSKWDRCSWPIFLPESLSLSTWTCKLKGNFLRSYLGQEILGPGLQVVLHNWLVLSGSGHPQHYSSNLRYLKERSEEKSSQWAEVWVIHLLVHFIWKLNMNLLPCGKQLIIWLNCQVIGKNTFEKLVVWRRWKEIGV